MGSRRVRGALIALWLAAGLGACRTLTPPDPARIAPLAADAGQLLLVGFHATEVAGDAEIEHLLCEARIGGIILFAHNIVDHDQVARLTRAASERALACTGRRLLVAVDAEGGSVMRLGPEVPIARIILRELAKFLGGGWSMSFETRRYKIDPIVQSGGEFRALRDWN